MRRRYLVAYDVSNEKRLRRVFRLMHGFGEPVQYSVFLCDLSSIEVHLLKEKLTGVMNQREDRVLIVDLGRSGTSASDVFIVLGRQFEAIPDAHKPTIV